MFSFSGTTTWGKMLAATLIHFVTILKRGRTQYTKVKNKQRLKGYIAHLSNNSLNL